ncbi:hypothetical protein JK208_05460 [Gluconobacter sp. Dm-74]|uniref:hypothetical protein n=1 Tax=Gluconobacter sp. Dm-74 TaxID=2799803 RepID=UPI001B8D0233|nr:hypothetical protein [Gluconobacter sp. Dm-74]MBS1091053.1 hypothetical protein [Gluconobacter sp. Dm-74]
MNDHNQNTSSPQNSPENSDREIVSVRKDVAESLQEALGINLSEVSPEILEQASIARISKSRSPYPSADMLADYRQRGMADVARRALDVIDEERRWRHARVEQDQVHAHALEIEESRRLTFQTEKDAEQKRSSQKNSFLIAIGSIIAALVGGYFHLPRFLCISMVVVGIGGPSTATAFARFIPNNFLLHKGRKDDDS